MNQQTIRKLFESRLATWAAAHSPVLVVGYENQVFTPPAALHLMTFLLPAQTLSPDLAGSITTYQGLFQVLIVNPNKDGTASVEAIVAELEGLFYNGLSLTDSGKSVHVIRPVYVGPPVVRPNQYSVAVRATYRADVP
jgi:hypothetical protein